MVKKDRWVLFCYAVIYNSFKKQAFWYGTLPPTPATGKDWGSELTTKLPIRVHTLWEIENLYPKDLCNSVQMRWTRYRPLILSLITDLDKRNGLLVPVPRRGHMCKEKMNWFTSSMPFSIGFNFSGGHGGSSLFHPTCFKHRINFLRGPGLLFVR